MNDQKPNEKIIAEPINVPLSYLSHDALAQLIDSFIFREGTDYGAVEIEHQQKILKIRKQLESGRIKIIYDPDSESVTLMTETDWLKNLKNINPA